VFNRLEKKREILLSQKEVLFSRMRTGNKRNNEAGMVFPPDAPPGAGRAMQEYYFFTLNSAWKFIKDWHVVAANKGATLPRAKKMPRGVYRAACFAAGLAYLAALAI
jgi:hypothetical protein